MTSHPDDILDDFERRGVALLRAETLGKRAREPRDPKQKKRQHPERDLQKQIVGFVNRFVPAVLVAAVTNEEQARSSDPEARARFGAARRAAGVLSGHPDLVVYLPGGRVLLWELKAAKGTVSVAQHLVHARLGELGHSVEIIRTFEAAMAALARAGVALPGRAMRQSVPVQPL